MIDDLIYDVGMHDGGDTAYYLSKGFRVLAVEANPEMVATARLRFADHIAANRLTVVDRCISDQAGNVTFWINDRHSEWSAVDKQVVCREGDPGRAVNVACVTFADLLAQYGIPYYLKIDIECSDRLCLDSIDPRDKPRYVSVEATRFDLLFQLFQLGYRKFKYINQKNHNDPGLQRINNESWLTPLAYLLEKNPPTRRVIDRLIGKKWAAAGDWKFPPGSSGPFGDEAFGDWLSVDQVAYEFLHRAFGYDRRGSLNRRGWYDFHATA